MYRVIIAARRWWKRKWQWTVMKTERVKKKIMKNESKSFSYVFFFVVTAFTFWSKIVWLRVNANFLFCYCYCCFFHVYWLWLFSLCLFYICYFIFSSMMLNAWCAYQKRIVIFSFLNLFNFFFVNESSRWFSYLDKRQLCYMKLFQLHFVFFFRSSIKLSGFDVT